MKYFRVKYGYGKDEFVSVDENEVRVALAVQVSGEVAVFKEGSISGNSIIAVLPDFNRLLGYKRDYIMEGEDYDQIPNGVQAEHHTFLENAIRALKGLPPREPLKALTNEVKALARKMTEPTFDK